MSEPVINVKNIQGNIIGGFKSAHQLLAFFRLPEGDVAPTRTWLSSLVPHVSNAEQVLEFNALFKARQAAAGSRLDQESPWLNVAVSHRALTQLGLDGDFREAAFREGLAARAQTWLRDPKDPTSPGHPTKWVFGGPDNEADILVILAGDDPTQLEHRLEELLKGCPPQIERFKPQPCQKLPNKHEEHFGFRDGVSQPGIRGRRSAAMNDWITPRSSPARPDEGLPGQVLVWPGEFLFGYPKQNAADQTAPGDNSLEGNPEWALDGSFLAVRRLAQDVAAFLEFIESKTPEGLDPDLFAARLVGRWKSGAPLMRAPTEDAPALGPNPCANNDFSFAVATPPLPDTGPEAACTNQDLPPAPADVSGRICPFASHIRRMYPRDGANPVAQTRRILRRGIPYGAPFSEARKSEERGLMFLCYQTSFVQQFESLQMAANNVDVRNNAGVRRTVDVQRNGGYDMIIGQGGRGREREFFTEVNGELRSASTRKDWVTPTGGGYFFAPSIATLRRLAGLPLGAAPSSLNPLDSADLPEPAQPWRQST